MKKLNWDKELKKVQRRGLYNPKVRVFSIIAVAVLTLGIGLTFSAFSYSSGDYSAFNSKVKKKVKVVIAVTNGSGAVNTTINYQSSGTVEYSVTPNSGYVVDEANTTCNYNSSAKKVIISPTADVSCKVVFKTSTLKETILASNNIKTSVPDFANYPDEANTGMFKAEDDEGTSYYYRGNIENNYVDIGTTYSKDVPIYATGVNGVSGLIMTVDTYSDAVSKCNTYYNSANLGYASVDECISDIQDYSVYKGSKMLWRIVRINGDGTIRLISDSIIGKTTFNSSEDVSKYVGYTYDNSATNIQNGTPSTIKSYLDNWYTTNITNKGLDSIVQTSVYCNDTSINNTSGSWIYYGSYGRINNKTPQLKCSMTEQKYGGKYVLKVGLLSADELLMAGYTNNSSTRAAKKTYIWIPSYFWTGTPRLFSSYAAVNGGGSSYIYANSTSTSGGVRPVINLKSDILISSGDGTKTTPYTIVAS